MDQQTQYQMANMQDAIRRIGEQQQRMAQTLNQRQQQAAAEKMVETLVKILSSSYDKAIAYNNVVIVAGYATFFAMWGATKPVLTHWTSIASALLMVSSATVFVLFELFKMIQTSQTFMQLQSIATDENVRKDPEIFQSKVKAFETLQRSASLRFVRVWVAVLGITVSTAVAAIGLLTYSYVCILIKGVA